MEIDNQNRGNESGNENEGLGFLVNYLGASPRGIRPKRTFNFEASLGVLYPLAVPIKSATLFP
ncbi:hypothetical protein A9200_15765 [Maribacter hydrothermalis]|uniref:Uncharacterized protein n=1 Tax=Maribacter hydrothermalis TaxID=1836467 RepID=A0A1B7ZCE2_9FLAO|nr:hypothetical protein BTR34_12105 [Maribacter hydrothermalis]OBR40569.1 hypothetical protein A9200_15765 [Maribacter hydrothermalis]